MRILWRGCRRGRSKGKGGGRGGVFFSLTLGVFNVYDVFKGWRWVFGKIVPFDVIYDT